MVRTRLSTLGRRVAPTKGASCLTAGWGFWRGTPSSALVARQGPTRDGIGLVGHCLQFVTAEVSQSGEQHFWESSILGCIRVAWPLLVWLRYPQVRGFGREVVAVV